MSQPLRRMPTTRGTLLMTDEPAPRLDRRAFGLRRERRQVGAALLLVLAEPEREAAGEA